MPKGEDGIWDLQTQHKPRGGVLFEVYDYSDTHLAACLPMRVARRLPRECPGSFTVQQDADDSIVLLFEESRLDELAGALKLRRPRSLSDEQRQIRRRHGGLGFVNCKLPEPPYGTCLP